MLKSFCTDLICMLQKAMAPHSSTLAWKIPWTEEPGRLQSMGSRRVVHNCATSLPLFTFMHWRREWQPTPVFLPEKSQGQRSLVHCSPWVAKIQAQLSDFKVYFSVHLKLWLGVFCLFVESH